MQCVEHGPARRHDRAPASGEHVGRRALPIGTSRSVPAIAALSRSPAGARTPREHWRAETEGLLEAAFGQDR